MKNRILKALASFGLSVCVLAGSSVVSMAEETPGKTECKEHTWKTTTEYKTECVETTFQHKLPDGTTETLTLCPVHTGTLKNGEQVMTAAFYYPTVIERVICEKCGTVKSEEVIPARVMAQPVIASIEVPANTVSGYSLMQINADGTETPVSVSYNTELNKAYFRLDVTTGAQLLRMVPTT